MSNAPETLWAEPDGDDILIRNGAVDLEALITTGDLYEYVRADIAQARMDRMEAALKAIYRRQDWLDSFDAEVNRLCEEGLDIT
tara:strand:+ start:1446 stop:1697 length:252 start_codon:yes stop_codon:yes gene_type:complete